MQGRPGPVVIALPEDMLLERAAVPAGPRVEPVETWPGLTQMADLQKRLWAAERPIMVLGGSGWSETACARVRRFAERFDLPVATSFRRSMLFPATIQLRRRYRPGRRTRSCRRASRTPIS